MKTSKTIDWLSITLPNRLKWQTFIPLADYKLQGKGRHGYGQMWLDRNTGAVIETASTRDDMGTHLTLSGDVLRAMRDELGATDDSIVKRIQEYDGKCTRIDLAMDFYGALLTPASLNNALLAKDASIPARTWRYIDGHKQGINGATIDTGSVSSDRRLRFYDKKAEQRIQDGEAWVRLELQLRRLYARSAILACAEFGVSGTVGGAIGQYLSWSNTDYQTAIAGESCAITSSPRKDTKRRKWLLGQVAKSLSDEIADDYRFFDRFMLAVCAFMEVAKD